jgi:hypothetical protein
LCRSLSLKLDNAFTGWPTPFIYDMDRSFDVTERRKGQVEHFI